MSDLAQQIQLELQPHFKQMSGSHHRYTCPWRNHADGHTLAVDYVTGKWYDHKDNVGGFLPSLAKKLGIQSEQSTPETKRGYKDLQAYADVQGAPASEFERAKVRQVTYARRKALKFPMRKPDGSGVQYQYRFLDGNKPAWKGQSGFKRCWYGFNFTTEFAVLDGGEPLVICNGATSVIVAQHHGIPAVAIPGGENPNLPAYLLEQLKEWHGDKLPEIVVAMDCDQKGRSVAAKLTENLNYAGYNARAVDLGLGDKGDLANFCKLHTVSSFEALKNLPAFTSADEAPLDDSLLPVEIPKEKIIAHGQTWLMMHAKDRHCIPAIEWIIPGEIPDRGLTVIYGTSGVGKSFFIIDRSLYISQENPVIYAALEGETGVPSRIDAWCKHHNKGVGELYLALGEVDFFNDTETKLFVEGAKAVSPKLVVIDTLARAMGDGDENNTRDMNKLVRLCKRISTALDCAVVLVHHTGKDGQRERGSYSLRGASDSMIQLVDDDDYIQVECSKTKDAKPFQTYFMTLLPVDVGVLDAHGKKLETPVIVKAERNLRGELVELTIRQRKVLEGMRQSVFEYGCTPSQVAQVVNGVPERSVYRIISRLKDAGFVYQAGSRKPYMLSSKGREIMGLPPADDTNDTNDTTAKGSEDDSNDSDNHEHGGRYGSSGSNGSNGTLFSDEELKQALDTERLGY